MKKKIFTTALLLFGILTTSQYSFGQFNKRQLNHLNNTQNSFVLPTSNGHYIITNNTTNGRIMVAFQDVNNITQWANEYNFSPMAFNPNVWATSCVIDQDDNIVILATLRTVGAPTNWMQPALLKLNSTGGILSEVVYSSTNTQHVQTSNIKIGADGDYYFLANNTGLTATQFNGGFIMRVDNVNPATIVSQAFLRDLAEDDQVGLYDLVQINGTPTWAVCGAYMVGSTNYNGLIFRFQLGTGVLGSRRTYVMGGTHDNFDWIDWDAATSDYILGTVEDMGGAQADNMGVMRMSSSYVALWHRRFNVNSSQRIGKLDYSPANNEIIIGGRSYDNSGVVENGFMISVNSNSGVVNWQKYPTNMGLPAAGDFFRTYTSGNDIYYCGNIDETGPNTNNLFTGKESRSAVASSCFGNLNYANENIVRTNQTDLLDKLDSLLTAEVNPFTPEIAIPLTPSGGCQACFALALQDNEITKITGSTVNLTGNNFWGANNVGTKYYIDADVVVNNGAVLDITGVDLIFSTNGRITVNSGGILRANNSVFRPCVSDEYWQGIYVANDAEAKINNCVIKQAVIGVSVGDVGNNGINNVQITNNQFSNCQNAIFVQNISSNNGSITNNVIFVDDYAVNYQVSSVYGGVNQYVGIYANNVAAELLISQNEFVYTRTTNPLKQFYGIYASQSAVEISDNNFTNCFIAVDIDNNLGANIENNEIEVTQLKADNYPCQIRIHGSSQDEIYRVAGNKLTNYNSSRDVDYGAGVVLQPSAIYTDFSQNFEIYDNVITGFNIGIHLADELTLGKIYSNTINDCLAYGIYAQNCHSTTIKCNVIEMDYSQVIGANQFPIGIAYKEGESGIPENLDIRGNCIFNTATAIALVKIGGLGALPIIENNFLYNYINNGIYIDNFLGNIGTTTPSITNGRNTFVSNNLFSGAIDINNLSVGFMQENGNYNVQSTAGVGGYAGAQFTYHSVASCAHHFDIKSTLQIGLEDLDKCDLTYFNEDGSFVNGEGGTIVLRYEKAKPIGNINDPNVRLRTWAMVGKLVYQNDTEEEKLIRAISNFEKDENVRLLAFAYLNSLNGDYEKAKSFLSQVKASAELMIAKNRIETIIDIYSKEIIAEDDIAKVMELTKEADFFANELRVFYGLYNSGLRYSFIQAENINIKASTGKIIRSGEFKFNIYPNPVNGNDISIDLSTPYISSSVIYVRDITGRVVATQQVNMAAGTVNVSVSNLTNGIYFVSIETEEEVIATKKLVVTH